MATPIRRQRKYDHRLKNLVRRTGDRTIASRIGIPRSTLDGWLRSRPTEVVSIDIASISNAELKAKIVRLERQCEVLRVVVRLLSVLIRVTGRRLNCKRLDDPADQASVVHAVHRASATIPLRAALKVIGLSSTRFFAWRRTSPDCRLDNTSSCPRMRPHSLTPSELATMKQMATSSDFKHVPTSRLAILAQRLGAVFASPSTWARMVRERRWRRPRVRLHPNKPKLGIRALRPNELWHIATTIFRLIDDTKAYVQAVIDNRSRRILAVRVTSKLEPAATAPLLLKALESSPESGRRPTTLMVDAGVENFNRAVDQLVEHGILRRLVAQTDLRFSNSIIEVFWRSLKNNWCMLHRIDSLQTLRRLVRFYVEQHNSVIPHSAFDGQTPDEVYFGTGDNVAHQLEESRIRARKARLDTNRTLQCDVCPIPSAG